MLQKYTHKSIVMRINARQKKENSLKLISINESQIYTSIASYIYASI